MSYNADRPILIKKVKKVVGGGHHGGAWKVAYADFVTAMMALFIVLWITAQDPKVLKATADYFRNPHKPNAAAAAASIPATAKLSPN